MITPSLPHTPSKVNAAHADDLELFKQYHATKVYDPITHKLISRDLKLRNVLATRNVKLVTFVVNKFCSGKFQHKDLRDDLLQEGNLGLFDAIDGFDPHMGFKFSTYGVWWVKQACFSFLKEQEPHLHVPSHVRTQQNKLMRQLHDRNEGLKDITLESMESYGVTEKTLACIVSAMKAKWVHSLDEPVSFAQGNHGHAQTLGDTIVDESMESLDDAADHSLLMEAARKALTKLTPREHAIMLLRYDIGIPPAPLTVPTTPGLRKLTSHSKLSQKVVHLQP